MKDLVEIKKTHINNSDREVVSAKELYGFLGLDLGHWERWSHKNIVKNVYVHENEDWIHLPIQAKSTVNKATRPSKDYLITIDFAKKLSMMARTQKGEEIRNYFLERERVSYVLQNELLKKEQQESNLLIKTLIDSNNKLASSISELVTNNKSSDNLKSNQINTNSSVINNENKSTTVLLQNPVSIGIDGVVTLLDLPDFNRSVIFTILRKEGLLSRDNKLISLYKNSDFFEVVNLRYKSQLSFYDKIQILPKGVDFIFELAKKYDYVPDDYIYRFDSTRGFDLVPFQKKQYNDFSFVDNSSFGQRMKKKYNI